MVPGVVKKEMKRMKRKWKLGASFFACFMGVSLVTQVIYAKGISYPEARKEILSEEIFGVQIEDPYRWMENRDEADLWTWVADQNLLIEEVLDSDLRSEIESEVLSENKESENVSFIGAGSGSHTSVAAVREMMDVRVRKWQNITRLNREYDRREKEKKLQLLQLEEELKRNLEKDRENEISQTEQWLQRFEQSINERGVSEQASGSENNESEDNESDESENGESETKELVFNTQRMNNGDLSYLRIYNESDGVYLDDVLQVKFSTQRWESAKTSFLYSSDLDGRIGGNQGVVRRHVLGTSQDYDEVLYRGVSNDDYLGLIEIEKKTHLVVSTSFSTSILAYDEELKAFSSPLWVGPADVGFAINNERGLFYVSYDRFSEGELYRLDPATWQTELYIPASERVIASVSDLNDRFAVVWFEDASHRVSIYNAADKTWTDLSSPTDEAATIFPYVSVEDGVNVLKASVNTYTRASTTYVYSDTDQIWSEEDEVSEDSELEGGFSGEIDSDEEPYELESTKVFFRSVTGSQSVIHLVYEKGLKLTSSTPLYAYGYGGFTVNITPRYSRKLFPFYKRGGVYAVVTLPGGREYGEDWHLSGNLKNKLNVFDDFAGAVKELHGRGISSPKHTALGGGSNGGLLVAATMERYPSLVNAAIPEVGVLDMLRFNRYTAGKFWVSEYGDVREKDMFEYMLSYSPYHQISAKSYPAVMVMTADFDDRVSPWHSFKYAARLQELARGSSPVLLHTAMGGGHGGPSRENTSEYRRDLVNFLSFLIEYTR